MGGGGGGGGDEGLSLGWIDECVWSRDLGMFDAVSLGEKLFISSSLSTVVNK